MQARTRDYLTLKWPHNICVCVCVFEYILVYFILDIWESKFYSSFLIFALWYLLLACGIKSLFFHMHFHSGIWLLAWLLSFLLTFFSPPRHLYLALLSSFLYRMLWISLFRMWSYFTTNMGFLSSVQCWKSSLVVTERVGPKTRGSSSAPDLWIIIEPLAPGTRDRQDPIQKDTYLHWKQAPSKNSKLHCKMTHANLPAKQEHTKEN